MSAWVMTVAILFFANGSVTQIEETRQVSSLAECRTLAAEVSRRVWGEVDGILGAFVTCEPATET